MPFLEKLLIPLKSGALMFICGLPSAGHLETLGPESILAALESVGSGF